MRVTWLGAVLAAATVFQACGGSSGGGGAPPVNDNTNNTTNTTTQQQLGSMYWYENDTLGGPYKTHDSNEASLAQQVFALVNQERVAAGVPPLAYDAQAERAGIVHSEDMFGRNYFSHTSPEGWTPSNRLSMTGASGFSGVGENIALGQTTAQDVMNAWMSSSGHRANILSPNYTHIGVGVRAPPAGTCLTCGGGSPATVTYWTQVFLTR